MENCHGCKYLRRYRVDGRGYCRKVVRSKQYQGYDDNIRKPDKSRCELYEAGEFATRNKEDV